MKREIKYDILIIIGLAAIILAHVNPSKYIFQLRNFDVVLMILISSYLGLKSYKNIGFVEYIKKRFIRLVIPTWIFLVIFFCLNFFFNFIVVDYKTIITSFSLHSGIGYIWIIRIYFIIAFLIPICSVLLSKSKKYTYIFTIFLYILYEIMCHFGFFNNNILEYLFAFIIPCYTLIIISTLIFNLGNKQLFSIIITSFVIFVSCGVYLYMKTGVIQQTQIMKYPFRLYYLSYGVLISSILVLMLNKKHIIKTNKIINFISKNSLWIYLWHILFIYIASQFEVHWFIKYMFTVICTVIIVYVQSKIIGGIRNKSIKKCLAVFIG